jgi:hypothetical protein
VPHDDLASTARGAKALRAMEAMEKKRSICKEKVNSEGQGVAS